MRKSLEQIAEFGCYLGSILSAVIAVKLFRMQNLTWINQMFLLYFIIDAFMGTLETFFSFKLYRERWLFGDPLLKITTIPPRLLGNEEKHIHNCVMFLTIWSLWNPHRMLFQFAMLFSRFIASILKLLVTLPNFITKFQI